jgi:predicted metalloprotease
MKWQGGRESENVRAPSGIPKAGLAVGGGIGGLILVLIVAFLGGDAQNLLNQLQQQQGQKLPQVGGPAGNLDDPAYKQQEKFLRVILASTEDVWTDQFRKLNKEYKKPELQPFFSDVQTGCGAADSGVGPFYCPADETIYIDPSFFQELATKFGEPGEFARAYVIAHEVGHHVQNLVGPQPGGPTYSRLVDSHRGDPDAHEWSVRLELQADYFAGVWGHYGDEKSHFLEKGDLESAVNAAWSIGDDTLQSRFSGRVNPGKFTHGTSQQRVKWFKRGFGAKDVFGEAKELFKLAYNKL